MNVCAVRLLTPPLDIKPMPPLDKLPPHEPKSEHRFALRLLTPEQEVNILGSWIGKYYECKH